MPPFSRAAALCLLCSACAPALRVTRVADAAPGMARYRIDDLVFEVPAAFHVRKGGAGVMLRFCGEPDVASCGALGVLLRLDVGAEVCGDRARFLAWAQGPAGEAYAATELDAPEALARFPVADADLQKLILAGKPTWMFADAGGRWRNLVVCDGGRAWVAKEIKYGEGGTLAASTAFNAFARTVRFEKGP